jgi:hypothetical protein
MGVLAHAHTHGLTDLIFGVTHCSCCLGIYCCHGTQQICNQTNCQVVTAPCSLLLSSTDTSFWLLAGPYPLILLLLLIVLIRLQLHLPLRHLLLLVQCEFLLQQLGPQLAGRWQGT